MDTATTTIEPSPPSPQTTGWDSHPYGRRLHSTTLYKEMLLDKNEINQSRYYENEPNTNDTKDNEKQKLEPYSIIRRIKTAYIIHGDSPLSSKYMAVDYPINTSALNLLIFENYSNS